MRFAAAAACAALLVPSSVTAQAANLVVGNVYTFSTGSTTGNPTGSWTQGDKTFTYLNSSGFSLTGPGGVENIQIDENANQHSFGMGNLNSFGTGTYVLGYRVNVDLLSQFFLKDVELSTTHLATLETVTKDVYSTLSFFTAAGAGDLANIVSTDGGSNPAVLFVPPLKEVWVRDTIVIGAVGALTSISNNFNQTLVPEIDATSLAGAFPLLVGGLALLERRRRRTPDGDAASAGS